MRDLLIAAAVGAALSTGAGLYLHNMRVDQLRLHWEEEKNTAIAVVKTEAQGICDANNKVTKEKSRDLQNRYDIINRNYDSLLKHAPSGNAPSTAPRTAGGNDGTPNADVQPVHLTIPDIGRQCDRQAASLIVLQDVVASIYKANGQSDLLPDEYNR